MNAALQKAVRNRAQHRCEYCHFPEPFAELPFHFDHIVARQHDGKAESENLAFACCHCNRYKGPNLSGVDPASGKVISLFHPRKHVWNERFSLNGARLVGKTAIGRATIKTLQLNRADAIAVRQLLIRSGEYEVKSLE